MAAGGGSQSTPEGPAAQAQGPHPSPAAGHAVPPALAAPCLTLPGPRQALSTEGTATLSGLLHLLGKRGPIAALKGKLPPLQPQALAAALA